MPSQRKKQGVQKHVFFITVMTRLQSRDIQVTDSDTNLCTQVFTVTPSETARVEAAVRYKNQCLRVNGVTLLVSTGSCYIHARVLYWMALQEIALSPSAPETS